MSSTPSTPLTSMMREIHIEGFGGPDVLHPQKAPIPQPGEGLVLIEVVAAGVNRPDCFQRAGGYPPPPGETLIPGLEVAGRIVAVGANVSGWHVGDEVCALVGSGGYAEFCVADARLCLPKPAPLTLIEAAGLPETFFTVYDNVFIRGRLAPGESFLVHGGSSGIGSTAIQLAKQFGATVYATAGSKEKTDFCLSLGADAVIDYRTEDFVAVIRALTQKKGVDVILDMVGGSYMQKNLSILAMDGRLSQIAFLQGSKVQDFDFLLMMVRRLTLTGATLRPRPIAAKATIATALREKVWPLLETGTIKPVIHATFLLEEAHEAHRLMESSAHLGKIVLVTGR